MASALLRNALECSSSGRTTTHVYAALRTPSRRAVLPLALGPAYRLVSARQRPGSHKLPQPPLWRKGSNQSLKQQLFVAQEAFETSEDDNGEYVDLEALNEEWAIPGAIEFGVGQGDLPTVLLTHPQTGMQLVVYLYGATIAQWLKSDGTATFYDGPDELYEAGLPLRTGVSLHFPQHREGLLPEHGFADRMMWEVVGAGFDCPEVFEQLEDYLEALEADGVVTEEMLLASQEGGEAAEAVRAALANEPPPEHVVDTDLAPSVTLRLRDTEETRALWPHKFELLYKITLETQDVTPEDVRDIRISRGLDPDGDDDDSDEDEAAEEEDEGAEEPGADGEEVVASGRDDAEEGAVEETEEAAQASAASTAPKRRGRPRKQDGGAAAEPAAASNDPEPEPDNEEDDPADDEDDEFVRAMEEEPGTVRQEPYEPAVQIKQEFWLRNLDEPGSSPMRFNLASLARFVTMQQPACSDWIKVLGLGGSQTFDYTIDPRYPVMGLNEDDYLHFRGQPVDVTYIGAADATVYMCPGNRTHFEFIQRAGFRDMFVQQPALDDDPDYERVACMGTGYVASTKKLAPGAEWYAQSIIRFHERYWRPPIFGDDSMPPLPPISQELLDEGEDQDADGGDAYDGLPSDPSDLAPDREE